MDNIIYTVNMEKNIKTVHIKNNPSCYNSKPYNHMDFNSMEELENAFMKMNKSFRKCEICFKKQYKNNKE